MISPFTLHQPDSIEAAAALLAEYGEQARILAGGSELVQLMKLGLSNPKHVIDIKRIPDLDLFGSDSTARALKIGPLVTHRMLERSQVLRQEFPLLAETAGRVGNVRLRNVGTLAGNLCSAHPNSDPGTLLMACQAAVKARSVRGERIIEISRFYVDSHQTALAPDEILIGIEIPRLKEDFSGTCLRFSPDEWPMVQVALIMGWSDGGCADVRLALGSVGPKPSRLGEVEEILQGLSAEEILSRTTELGERAARASRPEDDLRGSAEYKRHVVKVLVARALSDLCRRRNLHG